MFIDTESYRCPGPISNARQKNHSAPPELDCFVSKPRNYRHFAALRLIRQLVAPVCLEAGIALVRLEAGIARRFKQEPCPPSV
jgi:hypothetical protein